MAATQIMVELTSLRDVTTKMDSVIRSMDNVSSTIGRIHDKKIPVWEGKASEQYSKNNTAFQNKIKDYIQDVRLDKDLLEQAITAYEKTEGIQVRKVNMLDTKGIF